MKFVDIVFITLLCISVQLTYLSIIKKHKNDTIPSVDHSITEQTTVSQPYTSVSQPDTYIVYKVKRNRLADIPQILSEGISITPK